LILSALIGVSVIGAALVIYSLVALTAPGLRQCRPSRLVISKPLLCRRSIDPERSTCNRHFGRENPPAAQSRITSARGYRRFFDLYRGWRKTISPTMRQTHGPAE
jgi:hypothetical protein